MALYLSIDNGAVKLPSITFTKIEIDFIPHQTAGTTEFYLDSRTGASAYFYRHSGGNDYFPNGYTVHINGVQKGTPATLNPVVPTNERVLLGFLVNTGAATDDVNLFSTYVNASPMAASVYDVKFYNGSTIVAHYDMSTGTVQDQSGNGKHATLTGGTWLDDGTGGTPTGTDGTTAFDSRQSIYESSLTQAETKQIAYADHSQATDTRIAIYQDGASSQDTSQVLYEMSSAAFDTLQEIFNDGQVGATPFDIRVQLYEDNSAHLDTKQAVYDGGVLRYDVAQVIYESNTAVADVKAVIYADSAIKADALQTIYTDGEFNADALQRILSEFSEYSEVVRIVLEITQRRQNTLAITQQHADTFEIIQRKIIELHL